jgi:hypothetical protein
MLAVIDKVGSIDLLESLRRITLVPMICEGIIFMKLGNSRVAYHRVLLHRS